MKYFTKEWCFSDLEEKLIEETENKYNSYIEGIYDTLPFVQKLLCRDINFHDGIIKSVYWIESECSVIVSGIFGDKAVGYFSLEVQYFGVSNLKFENLRSFFDNRRIVIIRDEIERMDENIYSHRMLFSSRDEIEIIFKDIEIKMKNAAPSDYKFKTCEVHLRDFY